MPYVQADEVMIHYEIEGSGPPLVLLHGMSNNSRSWSKQLEALKEDYTVIAWDAPGYGKSSDPTKELTQFKEFANVLKHFLDELNLEWVYLLGHSMGAAIAIEFCNLYPNFVKALVLADATRGAAGVDAEENRSKLKKRLHSISTLSPGEMAQNRISALLSPYSSKEVQERVVEIMGQVRPMGYRSVAYSLYHEDYMDLLEHIQIPTLVVCGELDTVTPVSESRIIHERIAGSELITIPKTGHLCYQEDPATFNSHVMQFLHKCEVAKKV